MLFYSIYTIFPWFQPSCVHEQRTPPLMPEEARQAVRQASLWGANMRGVGGTICQPSLCPLCPPGQCWALKPPSPSAHLNPHDNRSRPYYSSRLAGGYLLLWQPACRKSRKHKRGGPRCARMSEKVYCISRRGRLQVRQAEAKRKLWCGVGVSGGCVWAGLLQSNPTTRCQTSHRV